ncbi:right-handed parallel beta-helix repeat-containing protein [Anaerolineales bacterium HSG6]|nr:right-handed parallel beta-helix repeat-containing protein [Anaerolineales bacterium HSG6]MDM8529726.1 right-handed parallel beta-helix repeat-containing protein [Anaerolineales bacterium HSG25]
MKIRLLILLSVSLAALFLNIPQNSSAQTYNQTFYIRPPGEQYGTGDGSDWTNALSDLPDELVRGAKYYMASGIYDAGSPDSYHVFDEAEQDDLYIGVIKATADDHGTDTGWEDSFGQGLAQLGTIQFISGYFEIDGQTGSGTQGHGFKLYTTDCKEGKKIIYFPWNSTSSYIELKHIDMGLCGPTTYTDPQDIIYSVNAVSNIIISDCYIHDANRAFIMMISWSDVLLENNYFARSGNQEESHSLGMRSVSNVTIRNNVFEDAKSSYLNLREIVDVYIYSNVFKRSANGDWEVYAVIDNYDTATNVLIYNNTIYNLQGLNAGVRIVGTLDNVQVYNNLWASSRANQIQLSGTHDYNAFHDNWRVDDNGDLLYSLDERMVDDNAEDNIQVITDNPFVAPDDGDFRLAFATNPGLTLLAPFDYDPDSVTRGEDGTWDRGVYEFSLTTPTATTAPEDTATPTATISPVETATPVSTPVFRAYLPIIIRQ